jgi:hypothetical protein
MIQHAPLFDGYLQAGRIEPFLQIAGYRRAGFAGDETIELSFFELVVWHTVS